MMSYITASEHKLVALAINAQPCLSKAGAVMSALQP